MLGVVFAVIGLTFYFNPDKGYQWVDSTICKKLNDSTTQCYHEQVRIKSDH